MTHGSIKFSDLYNYNSTELRILVPALFIKPWDLSMWISNFRTLVAATETFASFYNFWEMRLGYSNLALVTSGLLVSTSQAQCPGYTSYSQVNLLFWHGMFGLIFDVSSTLDPSWTVFDWTAGVTLHAACARLSHIHEYRCWGEHILKYVMFPWANLHRAAIRK